MNFCGKLQMNTRFLFQNWKKMLLSGLYRDRFEPTDADFELFQKFVEELGLVTCGFVIFFLRNIKQKNDKLETRNQEIAKPLCELLFDKDDEIMIKLRFQRHKY